MTGAHDPMTATDPVRPTCPECGNTNTMVLSDGMARCFDDQHEWDPETVTALPRPPIAPFAMASVEEVFGPPPGFDVEAPADTRAELVGGTARMEGGQLGTVTGFPDDDHVTVLLNDGRSETVALSDVETITARAPAFVPGPQPTADVTVPSWALDVEALSNLILRAGLAAIETRDGVPVVGDPPADWLPRDESSNALVEAAAALAVARLVVAYEIDQADVYEYLDKQTNQEVQGD